MRFFMGESSGELVFKQLVFPKESRPLKETRENGPAVCPKFLNTLEEGLKPLGDPRPEGSAERS